MDSQRSKENILKKIRKALQQSVPLPFPASDGQLNAFAPPTEDLAVIFGEEFTRLTGKFAYCQNENEAVQQLLLLFNERGWKEIYCVEEKIRSMFAGNGFDGFSSRPLAQSDASITSCEALVARTGSMVLSSVQREGRTANVYSPVHICIARTSQVVFDIKDALQLMQQRYQGALPSMISFASGPSRTADIEKTLVVGVHGPKEVYCMLIEDK